jgi:homoserine O-acetyltransferase/O-succinyltransferase
MVRPKDNIKIVETKTLTFGGSGDDFILENGQRFGPVTIAYETYGSLNDEKTNAVLALHALSGDAHAAGFHSHNDKKPGWWDGMIGPGKAFDTDKYFVICSNILGGCKGSTGPSSINPRTDKPFALDFPVISINDMVSCQKRLVDHLGIKKLLCVVGGSMGGMQVLAWLNKYPHSLSSAIPIATCLSHSPQQIAFNEVARQAIMADPNWKEGNYYSGALPSKGLAVARMLGHITYMSDVSMAEKFGRQKKGSGQPFKFNAADFEVEGYLHYHGDNFVKRFDANSFLYITKAMDNFNAAADKSPRELFKGLRAKVLVISFKSDWLYPSQQSKEIVKACKLSGVETTYCEIDSTYGHDAFLLETREETHLITHFLKKVFYKYEVAG